MSPLNIQCHATKANGKPCTLPANGPSGMCWGHDPANRERRHRMASKAARAKGSKEVTQFKDEIKLLISEVKGGVLDRNDASVMIQGYRALRDFVELERRVKETEDLADQIQELKREHGVA